MNVLAAFALTALRAGAPRLCAVGDGESTPLQRFGRSPSADVAGTACIPVPVGRMLAPGSSRTMHLYDSSCLATFSHAMSKGGGRFALAALAPAEAGERRFALLPIACEVAVLSWEPSTHRSKFGDASASVVARVVGCGRLRVPETSSGVVQWEPFLAVKAAALSVVGGALGGALGEGARELSQCEAAAERIAGLRSRLGLDEVDARACEQAMRCASGGAAVDPAVDPAGAEAAG